MCMRLLIAVLCAASVLTLGPAASSWAESTEHVVQPGETLRKIAERHGIEVADLIALNDVANPDLIRVGQVLRLPATAPAPLPADERAPAPARSSRGGPRPPEHVVQPGDTLTAVAERYGLTVADLRRVNDLANPDLLQVGQVLRLPPASDATPQSAPDPAAAERAAPPSPSTRGGARPAEHVVEPRETLFGIARRYGVSVSDLLALNEIPNPDSLQIGQVLRLRDGVAPQPPAAPAPVAATDRLPTVGGRYPIGSVLRAQITMYCLGGTMRYGDEVHEGAAAADASVFPSGTIIEVDGLGTYVVKDTFARDFGAVRLDIWEPDCGAARAWGLRYREITVVGP